jgi:hypothetical protein
MSTGREEGCHHSFQAVTLANDRFFHFAYDPFRHGSRFFNAH